MEWKNQPLSFRLLLNLSMIKRFPQMWAFWLERVSLTDFCQKFSQFNQELIAFGKLFYDPQLTKISQV